MKKLIELVLLVLVINSIIFSLLISNRMGYGKGELNQSERGGWYVYMYGPSVCGFNEVFIDNPEMFSEILKPQNIGMEVYYVFIVPSAILAYRGPRCWDFALILCFYDFTVLITLTTFLALFIVCTTLIYIITNRKKYQIMNKL